MLHLTLRQFVMIPLEAELLTPDHLLGKSIAQIEKLPVQQGNTQRPLADFFQIQGDLSDRILVLKGDCGKVKHIGQGMCTGQIRIEGNAGMHLGAAMRGGTIDRR